MILTKQTMLILTIATFNFLTYLKPAHFPRVAQYKLKGEQYPMRLERSYLIIEIDKQDVHVHGIVDKVVPGEKLTSLTSNQRIELNNQRQAT